MHRQDYSIYLQIIDSVKVKPPKRLKGVSHLQQIDEKRFKIMNLSESWNQTFGENLTSNWVEEVKFFSFSRPHNQSGSIRRTSDLFVKAASVISESHLTWKLCLSKQTSSISHFYIHYHQTIKLLMAVHNVTYFSNIQKHNKKCNIENSRTHK